LRRERSIERLRSLSQGNSANNSALIIPKVKKKKRRGSATERVWTRRKQTIRETSGGRENAHGSALGRVAASGDHWGDGKTEGKGIQIKEVDKGREM